MATFKCNNCGNLHGARVDNCGSCGSPDVPILQENPPTLPPPPLAGIDPEQAEEVTEALIDCLTNAASFFRAGAEWFRSNTDTKRDPLNPDLRGEKWPGGPSSPTVDGKK